MTEARINLVYHRPLQLAVMGALWREKRLNFHQLHSAVSREYKPIGQSTLSTTLTRLIDLHWATRVANGVYRAAVSREELIAVIARAIEEA